MVCNLIDFRCIFVSEIAGTALMAAVLFLVLYFIAASKLNWGFITTVGFLIPIVMITGLAFTGFTAIMAFLTIATGLMLAWIFNRFTSNR